MNTHTSQVILDKIRAENIKPKARWYFMVRHAVLWVPAVIVTGLGTLAFAGELYAIAHSGYEVREFIYPSQLDFFLATIPTLWAVSFFLFGAFIVKAFRTTHTGYRFSVTSILIGSVLTSAVLGAVIFYLDQELQADSIIRYPIHLRDEQIWFSPEMGRISGVVEGVTDNTIVIRDKSNMLWTVDTTGFSTVTPSFIAEGKSVRILGTSSEEDDHGFIGCAIFPWEVGTLGRPDISQNIKIAPPQLHVRNKNQDCVMLLQNIKDRIRGH